MRAMPLALVAVLAVSGCAPWQSYIAISSDKPVAIVAGCIAEQWNRQYPQVSSVAYGDSVAVRAHVGPATLMDASVRPSVYGSHVRLSTYHHEMLSRGHPIISSAVACAN